MSTTSKSSGGGLGIFATIGLVLAVILSWTANKSILWVILHGLCGWLYVIYWAIFIR